MNTRKLVPVKNPSNRVLRYGVTSASAAATLGAYALGYSGAVTALLAAGTVSSSIYSYFSRSKPPMDTPDIAEVLPRAMQTPAPTPTLIVKPVTTKDLAGLTLRDQEQLLFERTRQIHEQEAHKAFIAKLMGQQNVIVETEKETEWIWKIKESISIG